MSDDKKIFDLISITLSFYLSTKIPTIRLHSITKENLCTCGDEFCKMPGCHPISGSPFFEPISSIDDIKYLISKSMQNIGIPTGDISGLIGIEVKETKEGNDSIIRFIEKTKLSLNTLYIYSEYKKIYLFKFYNDYFIPEKIVDDNYPDIIIHGDGSFVPTMPSKGIGDTMYLLSSSEPNFVELTKEFHEYIDSYKENRKVLNFSLLDISKGELKSYFKKFILSQQLQEVPIKEVTENLTLIRNRYKIKLSNAEIKELIEGCSKINIKRKPIFKIFFGTEFEISYAMKAIAGNKILYLADKEQFIYWDDNKWVIDQKNESGYYLYDKVRKQIVSMYIKEKDSDIKEKYFKTIINLHRNKKLKDCIEFFINDPHNKCLFNKDFDNNKYQFNTLKETIDFQTGAVYSNFIDDKHSKVANVIFDKNAICPKWNKFLLEITNNSAGSMRLLQKMVGYCLIDDNRLHTIFILIGNGANGKSTFINILRELFGDYAITNSIYDLTKKTNANIGLARAKGTRMVVIDEADGEVGDFLDSAFIKLISSCEIVSARFLYENPFEFIPGFKAIIACNDFPAIKYFDDALQRRIIPIPFEVEIPKEEQNPNLFDELKEELPGILQWAIFGLYMVTIEGFDYPFESKKMLYDYKMQFNNVEKFINETCIRGRGYEIGFRTLYDFFKWYSEINNDRTSIKEKTFSNRLKQMGFKKKRVSKGIIYLGLMLKDPVELATQLGTDVYCILKDLRVI